MQTIEQYLDRTESASQKLFEGINGYMVILRDAMPLTFISSTLDKDLFEKEYASWRQENEAELNARLEAENSYIDESFALANLCGAVLQTASMGINQFSARQPVPPTFQGIMEEGWSATKYCIGREVRGVPIGLIILAGRNQYNHFDERPRLKNPAKKVFQLLADMGKSDQGKPLIDPAFNLQNDRLICFASNITGLLGWDSYDDYRKDMITMLSKADT